MSELEITPIIGVEVHVELETKSKMFCGCPAWHFDTKPNSQTCPVCLGLPGALPVPNKAAIEQTIMIGLALGCEVADESKFDRKNYFYPDLPKGYQISQYDQPLCSEGELKLASGKVVGIERVHLEEDTGKLQHAEVEGRKVSLVDFNRSGVPLVEIVSKPDLASAEEAKEYLKKLKQVIVWLGVSKADMEKGQMRLEPTVNVKIKKNDTVYYTPLVEVKNINSFNFAAQAIEYEVERQVEEWEETGVVKNKGNKTTRGYDSVKKVTFVQRRKEEANDYRYFPEPDIPPLLFGNDQIAGLRKKMPELPEEMKKKMLEVGVRNDYAEILLDDKQRLLKVLEMVERGVEEKVEVNKLVGMVINKNLVDFEIEKVIEEVKKESSKVFASEGQTKEWIIKAIRENPQAVVDYAKGKGTAVKFLMGQVMRLGKGQVDPKNLEEKMLEQLRG